MERGGDAGVLNDWCIRHFAFHFSPGFVRIVLDSKLKLQGNPTQDFDLCLVWVGFMVNRRRFSKDMI